MEPRSISGTVPTFMVPDLLRAAGYYPSEEELAGILSHIAFMAHSRDMDTIDEITFDELIALYVNHRPLIDVSSLTTTQCGTLVRPLITQSWLQLSIV